MNITRINQQTKQNNTTFGWKTVEVAGAFDKSVNYVDRLLPGFKKEIESTIESIQDGKYNTDNRVMRIIPEAIQLFDEKLGNISYKIDLNKPESIINAAKQAFIDRVNLKVITEQAENLSEKHGINLTFSPEGAFYVANENLSPNPVEALCLNCMTALRTIARKASEFKDKKDIQITLARSKHGNTFALSMQKGNITSSDDLFINGKNSETLAKHVEDRLEKQHEDILHFFKS